MHNKTLKFLICTASLAATLSAAAFDERNSFKHDPSNRHYKKESFVEKVKKHKMQHAKVDTLRVRDVDVKTSKEDESIVKNTLLKEYLDKIMAKPLSRIQLERYVLLIKEIPGFIVEDELKERANGDVDLVLTIRKTRGEVGAVVNNYGTPDLGRYNASVFAVAHNPFGINDRLAFDFGASNRHRSLTVTTLSYSKILNTLGTSVNVIGSALNANSFRRNNLIAPRSENDMLKGYIAQQVFLHNSASLAVDVGAEARRVKGYTVSSGVPASTISDYRYVLGFISASARYKDKIGGENMLLPAFHTVFGSRRITTATSPDNNFDRKFNYFSVDYVRDQTLPLKNTTLFLDVLWQATGKKLPNERQFAADVHTIARGYKSGVVNSDKGINGNLELRYKYEFGTNKENMIQPYLFANAAHFESPRDYANITTLYSAGAGIRGYCMYDVNFNAEIAQPLKKKVVVSDAQTRHGTKFTFNIAKSFSW